MERKAFSFLSWIARLKERKSPSRLETIESNISNLVSKIETCSSFATGSLLVSCPTRLYFNIPRTKKCSMRCARSLSYRSLTKRFRRLARMVEYTHEHFYLHFKLNNAWLDHYQSKLFSLYLLWSLNLHEEKNRSLGFCSTKKLDF